MVTRSDSGGSVPFRAVYLPQDSPPSEYVPALATPSGSELSFDIQIPEASQSNTHLLVLEPLEDAVEIVISSAFMEVVEQ